MERYVTFLLLVAMLFTAHALFAATAVDGSIIIDHGDAEYAENGAWENSGDGWEERGQSYSLSRRTKADGAWAKWTPNLPKADTYRVYFWNIPFHSQDGKASIEVGYDGGTKTITKDMHAGYFGWIPLGDFKFKAGTEGFLKITRGDRTLMVDAARFQRTAEIAPVKPLEPYPTADGKLPFIDKQSPAGHLILGGKPYLMLGAELENTSALEPCDIPYMDSLFDILCEQKINTVLAPICWKQLEAKEDQFDFSVIDALIERARARNMHLIILWFGTYKNLQSYYAPLWVIHDKTRFVRMVDKDGKENPHCVSAWCEAAIEADIRAFSKLMDRIETQDATHQVVLMVQVENEMPSWRDYGPVAQEIWKKPVPKELLDSLMKYKDELSPWLQQVWKRNGNKTEGTWAEVFGEKDGEGGRVFGTWAFGRFTERVAKAGKSVHALPMFINAWRGESPCDHRYMDIVHAAAPSLDCMGPDVYLDTGGYSAELALSVRSWNNLVVPENNSGTASAVRPWVAYGTHNALLYANYWGAENRYARCGETYALMTEMALVLLGKKGTGDMHGFVQEVKNAGETWKETFQGLAITLTALDSIGPAGELNNITGGRTPGGGWIGKMGAGDYVILGTRLKAALTGKNGDKLKVLAFEAGRFEKGTWVKEKDFPPQAGDATFSLDFPEKSGQYAAYRFRLEEPKK